MANPPIKVSLPRTNTASGRALYEQAQKGMRDVLGNLNRLINWVSDEVVPAAIEEALRPTMDLSDHYAPKDTGTMVASRYTSVKKDRKGRIQVEVGYNRRGEAPYTIFVHEMPQFYHKPPTQYKFLQKALDEDTPEIVGRVAASIRRRTGT